MIVGIHTKRRKSAARVSKLHCESVERPFAVVLNNQPYKNLAARTDSGYPILSHVRRLVDGEKPTSLTVIVGMACSSVRGLMSAGDVGV
jgi:uncharacterized linocin/CFP29 family protein